MRKSITKIARLRRGFVEQAGIFILAVTVLFTACDDNGSGVNPEPPEGSEIPVIYKQLPGTLITENTTWSSDTTLSGPHFVLPGVTLTIEPGVTVKFEYHNGISSDVGTIITLPADAGNFEDGPRPSAKLVAVGTAGNPIIFTSARENPQINDWGGIILIGDAPTNINGNTGNVEGLPTAITYGGDNNSDNSGTLSYVRIEYSGFSIAEGSELQGLSLYAVGSETTINHINIFKTSDDGIEIFGGTVDLKYVVVYGVADDSFDFDQGWQGRGQFWLGVQVPGANNGFENDGCADGSNECAGGNGPTSATIFNATVYSANDTPDGNYGLKLREGLLGSYNNIIVANFVDAPFWLLGAPGTDDAPDNTYENYENGLELNSFIIYNNGSFYESPQTPDGTQRYASDYTQVNPQFVNSASFNFALQTGSPALNAGVTPPDDGFFTHVNYIGAIGTTNWTQEGSWVRWP